MSKDVYIKAFRKGLSGVSKSDVEEAVREINNHIEVGKTMGQSEEEILETFIDPKALATLVKAEYTMDTLDIKLTFKKLILMFGLLVSLGFVNIIFLPVIFSVIAVIVSFYVVVMCLYLTGGLMIISPLVGFWIPGSVSIPEGSYIALVPIIGLGLMVLTRFIHKLMDRVTKYTFKGVIKYLKLNIAAFKS